jgi:methionyl-tRNA synthetase
MSVFIGGAWPYANGSLHSLILPAFLKGIDENLHLPDRIISSEYLMIEGKKLSTSRNWPVWAPYILENYQPDSIRYYLAINGPEKRDCNFSWEEFIHSHNGELLGAYGNFVNRVLVFLEKKFAGQIPAEEPNKKIEKDLIGLYAKVGKQIERGEFKKALEDVFSFVRRINKYFDSEKPWITVKEDIDHCKKTIYNCVLVIANLSTILSPFLPFSTNKVRELLKINNRDWEYYSIGSEKIIRNTEKLFTRIDKAKIKEERERLQGKAK